MFLTIIESSILGGVTFIERQGVDKQMLSICIVSCGKTMVKQSVVFLLLKMVKSQDKRTLQPLSEIAHDIYQMAQLKE